MSIRVVTDSTCDLSRAEIEQHGITIIPLYVNIDGQSYRDGVDLQRDEFYARLSGCDGQMSTSAPGPGVFVETYRRLADEGATSIISLHLSSELSNVCQVAQMAAQEVPSVPVHVLDSGNISLATGLAAMVAAEEAAKGSPLPALIQKVRRFARRSYCYAVLDTVEHLRRSGRVSQIMSTLATFVQIKPLVGFANGVVSIERVRTLRNAMARLLGKIGQLGNLGRLTVLHTNAPERAESFLQLARELVPADALSAETRLVTPVLCVHLGPGAVGFAATTRSGADSAD